VSYFTLARESEAAPAGNRAMTRASIGQKICPRSKSRPQWALAWL